MVWPITIPKVALLYNRYNRDQRFNCSYDRQIRRTGVCRLRFKRFKVFSNFKNGSNGSKRRDMEIAGKCGLRS